MLEFWGILILIVVMAIAAVILFAIDAVQMLTRKKEPPTVYFTQHWPGCKAMRTGEPHDCDCPHGPHSLRSN